MLVAHGLREKVEEHEARGENGVDRSFGWSGERSVERGREREKEGPVEGWKVSLRRGNLKAEQRVSNDNL